MKCQQFAQQLGRIEHRHGHSTKASRGVLQCLVNRVGAAYVIAHGKIAGYRMPDGSMVCRKRRFPHMVAATAELRSIAAVSKHSHIPVRAYACPDCKGFHLTSSE
ncbi:MAG TPA: hypothetical protein VGV14_10585 [Rhodanobacter sp.]|nr:hypothetical protein [Rhodanobacter sp.]